MYRSIDQNNYVLLCHYYNNNLLINVLTILCNFYHKLFSQLLIHYLKQILLLNTLLK